ncbi:MAG TPA: efflux RND transporter periplasmic adaptor subunit [Chitinophagales bacterium]|nr:efflux RND transporter periplasmic adaptor subunit [Chitinophagales bacterium]HRK27297.1 efflux RND transporter periplasmic adaptor subunit [Chitinophagales bacterium]
MKKKATLHTTLALIGLILLGTSCHKSDAPAAAPPTGAQKGGAPMLSATGFVVKPITKNNKIVSSGRLAANELVSIQPEINGKITEILFSEGATLSKGALLIKLSDTDLQAQMLKVNTQRQLAVTTEQRQKKLLDINGISRQEYDLTTTQIKGFDADLEILKAQLEKTEIRAPFSGVMGLRNVSLGAVVSPATVISTLQQVNPLKLEFSVPEKYLPQLKVGQKIRCSFAGLSDTLIGSIYVINPTIDAVTGTILAKAKIDNPKNKLSPGQFANVEVVLNSNPTAMVIPPQSVIPGTRFKQVAVYKNGEVLMKQVITGDRTESEVEILQGLAFGDTILTTGIMQARDKAKVKLSGIVNGSE